MHVLSKYTVTPLCQLSGILGACMSFTKRTFIFPTTCTCTNREGLDAKQRCSTVDCNTLQHMYCIRHQLLRDVDHALTLSEFCEKFQAKCKCKSQPKYPKTRNLNFTKNILRIKKIQKSTRNARKMYPLPW